MTTSERWIQEIQDACADQDPARSNRLITSLHYRFSEALVKQLGRDAGPNFHSWAVWGSRKAGVTIRQEDLGDAINNATKTGAVVGAVLGLATGLFARRRLGWIPNYIAAALGAGIGGPAGGWSGKQIAIWSRGEAARLILEGNQTVIQDIGTQSARFLELLENGATSEDRAAFFAGMRPGPTERRGQDRLKTAFASYLVAFDSADFEDKRAAMISGNCQIVYHEHIRLEPYIRRAMPFIVRRCATQRLMTYEVGDRVLTVGTDLPGVQTPTAASNWARIEDRMRYVFALFRSFHTAPEVFLAPFPEMETRHETSEP
jgi:hypothetical protein